MKDSRVEWIGDIPSTWTTSKLKYIGKYINGYAFKSSMFTKSGTRVLRLQDLSKSYINPQYFEGTLDQRFVATKGDILVSWNATLDTFLWDGEDAYFKHHILKAIPNEGKVSKAFFYWLLKLAMKNMSGDGIVMTHLRLGVFSDFTVPMPPLAEQTRIAEYLNEKCSEIDGLIAQTRFSIEEYKALLLSYISNAVTKGIRADRTLVNSGYSIIGQIPSEWSVSKIKNLYEVLNGIPIEGERIGEGYPFLSYGDIDNLVLPETANGFAETTEAERKRYTVQSGDIFFTRTTESLESVGISSVCLSDIENATYTSLLVRVRPLTDSVLPGYAKYYFRSSHIKQYIHSKVNRGASVNLTQEVLKAMPVLIPTKEEQIEIVTYLDEKYSQIIALIEKKQALIKEMENYKYSVIFEALTGKKEVQMKDSGIEWIGEIPRHWKLKRLKALFEERKEKNDPIQTDFILSLGAAYGVVPYAEKEGGGNKAKEDLSDYRLAYPNDIVMNSMNIISGSVGISKYYGCVSPVYYMLYPRFEEEANPFFYCYMFQTKAFQRSLLGLGNGILIKESANGNFNTVRMRIPMEKLGVQLLPTPPIEEQKAIADFLDTKCAEIDAVIAQTKATIEEYKTLKQSVITEAVTKGIRGDRPMKDSGVEWIGDVPTEWEVSRFKNVINSLSKGNGITKEEIVENGDTPCVRYGEIYTKYNQSFSVCETRTNQVLINPQKYFSYGDILVTCTGELVEEIGKSIVYLGEEQCLAGGDIIVVSHSQNPSFLNYAFNSVCAQAQKSCSKTKLKVVHISASDISNVIIAVPTLDEQKEIADYLDQKCSEIDTLIAKKTSLLEEMEALKKSIIFEYVTGKKKVLN